MVCDVSFEEPVFDLSKILVQQQCYQILKLTYLKFSFCVLGIGNTYNLVINELWETLQGGRFTLQRGHIRSVVGKKASALLSYVKVPERENRDDHGGRAPAFAVGAVENEG